MARREKLYEANDITREMIRRCKNCEVLKTCTIPIANIAKSNFCLYPNKEQKIYVKLEK